MRLDRLRTELCVIYVRKREVKVERKRRKWIFSVNQNRSSTKCKREEDDDDPKIGAKAYLLILIRAPVFLKPKYLFRTT